MDRVAAPRHEPRQGVRWQHFAGSRGSAERLHARAAMRSPFIRLPSGIPIRTTGTSIARETQTTTQGPSIRQAETSGQRISRFSSRSFNCLARAGRTPDASRTCRRAAAISGESKARARAVVVFSERKTTAFAAWTALPALIKSSACGAESLVTPAAGKFQFDEDASIALPAREESCKLPATDETSRHRPPTCPDAAQPPGASIFP